MADKFISTWRNSNDSYVWEATKTKTDNATSCRVTLLVKQYKKVFAECEMSWTIKLFFVF